MGSTRAPLPAPPLASGNGAVALGNAVELAGRMQAMANAAMMHALLSLAQTTGDKRAAQAARLAFRTRIDGFARALAALKDGDPERGIDAHTVALLDAALWQRSDHRAVANRFVAQAYFVDTILDVPGRADPKEVMDLAALCAGPLEETLDSVIAGVTALLAERSGDRDAAMTTSRDLTRKTVTDLRDLTRRIRLIAVNASIEAARAGDAGRGFNAIALEIKTLSDRAQTAVDQINDGLAHLE